MGIIQSGILSKVSGKVAGVVGGSWKDKAYLRAYVKPANPNTAAQQVQRTKFKDCVEFAKPLVGQVFNAYTDKFQKSMSGFNFFIKNNIDIFDGSPVWSQINPVTGKLSFVSVTAAQLVGTTVTIAYTPNNGNNGLDTDKVFMLIYDTSNGRVYFPAAETTRIGGAIDLQVEAGSVAANLQSWTWAAQYVGTVLSLVSYTWYEQVTV